MKYVKCSKCLPSASMHADNTVENDFFGFPKVKWLQYTGKVGKHTSYGCHFFMI